VRDRRLRQRDRGSSTIEAVTATLAGTGTTAQAISGHGDAEWSVLVHGPDVSQR
jgi:hypothetical protein